MPEDLKNEAITAAKNVYANLNSKFSIDNFPFKEMIEMKIPSPLTAEVELIPNPVLDEIINTILCTVGKITKEITGIDGISILIDTYKKAGLSFIDVPGLGSILKGLIRSIESNVTVMLKPYIFAVQIVIESVKKGVKAIPYFISTISKTISDIIDALSDPYGLVFPIIGMFISTIVEKANFPLPNAEVVIAMVTKPLEFDWCKLLKDILANPFAVLTIPSFFFAENKINEAKEKVGEAKEKVDAAKEKLSNMKIDPTTGISYLQQYLVYFNIKIPAVDGGECGTMFDFIKEFLLMPVKMIIEIIKSLFCTIKEMLTNLFKTIKNISQLASDPIQYIYGFVSQPLMDTLSALLAKFFPQADATMVKELIEKIFGKIKTLLNFDVNDLKKIICEFIEEAKQKYGASVQHIIEQLRNFLLFIASTFLSIFKAIFDVPKIIAALFGKSSKDIQNMTCEEADALKEQMTNEFKVFRPTKSYQAKIDSNGNRYGILTFYYDKDTKLSDQFEDNGEYSPVEFYHEKLSKMYGKDIKLVGEIKEIHEGKKNLIDIDDPYIVLRNEPAYEYVKNNQDVAISLSDTNYEKFVLVEDMNKGLKLRVTKNK